MASITVPIQVLPKHDVLVLACKNHILSLHCTLWQDWLVEPDKVHEDGTVEPRGLTKAAEWLASTIEKVLTPNVKKQETLMTPGER